MTLSDAITAVEAASTGYTNATTLTASDQAVADQAAAKLAAAQATVATDQTNQTVAAQGLNAALTDLITAAQAAMIPTTPATT
jgi:hypothetical protein